MATASIQERTAKDGSTTFRIRWDKGIDPATGKRRQGSETVADPATGRTLRVPPGADQTAKRGPWPTAMAKVQARRAAILAGDEPPDSGKITVADYLRHWLRITADRLPSTHSRYTNAIERHLIPALGVVRLTKLDTLDIEAFLARQREAGYAPNTVASHRAVLAMALDQAVRWKIVRANPCANLAKATHKVGAVSPAQVWSEDELLLFLAESTKAPDIALWRLMAATGMRLGEALALQWGAIDWERRRVSIRRTLSKDGEGKLRPREGTKGGDPRTVTVDQPTIDALRAHRTTQRLRILQATRWEDPSLVFPNQLGKPLDLATALHRFRQQADRVGVKSIRLHDLRHTHATLLLVAGVHPKFVQERLGHKKIQITMDLYSHVIPSMENPAVDAIDAMLNRPRVTTTESLVTNP